MSNETKQTAVDSLEKAFYKYAESTGINNNKWLIDEEDLDKLINQSKEMERERMIDFASWIAESEWMSIWVFDKWMWECQKENSNTNYKTDKELFDIYYNETYGGNK